MWEGVQKVKSGQNLMRAKDASKRGGSYGFKTANTK